MKTFLKSLFSRFGNRQSAIGNVATKSWASAWLAGREDTLPGHSMLTSAYQQSSWVYACITTLAESVSAIPFRFVDKNGNPDTSAFSLQLSALFDNPHPQLDRFQFWELIVIWLCLRGEAFIYPIESSSSSSSIPSPLSGRGLGEGAPRVRGEFHVKSTPIMQSAQRARFETATKLFSMGIPLNIINKNLDLGLPKLPHGDKAYLPTQLQEVGSHVADDPAPEEPQEPRSVPVADALASCLRLLPALRLTLTRNADCQSAVPQAGSLLAPNGKPHPRF